MINKEQTLNDLKILLSQGLVQAEEVQELLQASTQKNTSRFINLAYYLGALIIIAALIILLNGYWKNFGLATKLIIMALAPSCAYYAAIYCQARLKFSAIATPFFIIFAVLIPITLATIFKELDYIPQGLGSFTISGLSLVACYWAFYCFRRTDLLTFCIFYGSLLIWSILTTLFDSHNFLSDYLVLATLGCSYAFVLKPYWQQNRPYLAMNLGGIGLFLILLSVLLLRNPNGLFLKQATFLKYGSWEALMTLVLVGNFYLATQWRDSFLVVIGALFLILFLSIITSVYFSASLGWPLSLLLLGLAIIAIAWGSWSFYEKKIQSS